MEIKGDRSNYLVFKKATQVTLELTKLTAEQIAELGGNKIVLNIDRFLTQRVIKVSKKMKTASSLVPIRFTYNTFKTLSYDQRRTLGNKYLNKSGLLDISNLTEESLELRKSVEEELCVDLPEKSSEQLKIPPLTNNRLVNLDYEDK